MKDGARSSTHAEPAAREPAKSRPPEPARTGGGIPNLTIAHHVRSGGSVAGFPGAPLDNQQQQSRALPYRSEMERSFGRSLDHLRVRTGVGELGAFGARALTTKDRVAFREASPSPSLVAHEVTHALQHERGGGGGGLLASRGSAAEHEADTMASLVARQGAGTRLPAVSAAPAGQVHFAPNQFGGQVSSDQEELLRKWIAAESGSTGGYAQTSAKPFDPSLARPNTNAWPKSSFAKPGGISDADREALVKWIQADGGDSGSTGTTDTAAPSNAHTTPSKFGGAFPMTGSTGFPSFGKGSADPFGTKTDFFGSKSDPLAPKYDPNVCHTNCHGVVYQRMQPPAPAAPSWEAPDKATGEAAVKKESQSTEDTIDQIDLQVLTAKAKAIEAAASGGKLPADLQNLWQQATLAAEALRIASPALARPKPGTPPPAPATPPPTPKPPATPAAPDLDATAAEAARTAIDAFYWSLVDALQVKEADAKAFADQWNSVLGDDTKAQPQCPGNCHTPAPTHRQRMQTPAPVSPYVIKREKDLMVAESVEQWRNALRDFDTTSTRELEELLVSLLPPEAKELKQLKYATDLRDRLRDLQADQPAAIRIPAVFYPQDDIATDGKAQGYSWYLFAYQQPDGVWVLKDLTSNKVFTNKEGGDVQAGIESFALTNGGDIMGPVPSVLQKYPDGVLTRLVGQLDSELHMPKGMLYYTLPGGRQKTLKTTASWSLSDWLKAIGLTLAAIGIVALTLGEGTPAAIALVASGLVGAAGTKAGLEEMEAQGIATDSDRAKAYLTIAQDLVSALTGGLGLIARAPATFGQLAMIADRVYLPMRAIGVTLDVAQAAVMTHDFFANLQALAAQPDSKERTVGIMKLVAMGIAMGALSFAAIKGGVHELTTSGARPRVVANGDGTFSVVGPNGLPLPAPEPGTGLKLKAPVAETVEDASVGGKSVVVDVERNAEGLVTGVAVRKGPLASAADVALHERVADMVARYGGLQGKIRNAWREILAKFGIRRPPIELELEVWKLEESARLRMKRLTAPGVNEAERAAAEKELAIIESNLEKAKDRVKQALLKPPETPAQRAQIWMKEAPEGLPPPPENTQWVRNERGQWDLVETGPRTGTELRAVYNKKGEFLGISNKAQLQRGRVVGRRLDEVRERLEAMGYTVDTIEVGGKLQPRIRRPGTGGDQMVDLQVDPVTGIVKGPAGAAATPATTVSPKHGYEGSWPPPEPGPRPAAGATPDDMAAWRYRRYAYDNYKSGKLPDELLTAEAYKPYAIAADTPGARPGRSGGEAQQKVRNGPAKDEGFANVEDVQLGTRTDKLTGKVKENMVDGVRENAKGGTDYLEVDDILKNGLPRADMRAKLKEELKALKQGDTLEYWDKNDPTRRIRYEYGENPEVVDIRTATTLPRKPRTPKG